MASNRGYAEEAEALMRQYEALRFEDVQGWLLPLRRWCMGTLSL